MKVISSEFQQELIEFIREIQQNSVPNQYIPAPAYFLEELRPKRIRKKVENTLDNPVET